MSDDETEDTRSGPPMFNIVAGILLAAVSLWLLNVTIPNNIGQAAGKNDISPALFPTMAAWLLLGLSLALAAVHAAKLRVHGSGGSGQDSIWIIAQFVIWMVTATLVYFGLLVFGFVVVTAILIGLGALACGYRNYWIICGLAVVTPLILSQLAWSIFQVQLP